MSNNAMPVPPGRLSAPEPGIYENVTFADYLRWEAVSNSGLSGIERSPLHYKHRAPIEETDAMRFGTLCHSGRLEPASVFRNYVVMPDLSSGILTREGKPASSPKATQEYKDRVAAWEAAHAAGKEVVSQGDFDAMVAVVSALDSNPVAHSWFSAPGATEVCIVWQDASTGILCKGRLDKLALSIGIIADLKTTRDCLWFGKQIADRRYYRQAALYIDGVMTLTGQVCRFGIVAVENVAPYGVMAAPLADAAVDLGRDEYKSALSQIAESCRTNHWPGYESPSEWTLPAWRAGDASEELTLSIGGAQVSV
jgi:hypothetical protein